MNISLQFWNIGRKTCKKEKKIAIFTEKLRPIQTFSYTISKRIGLWQGDKVGFSVRVSDPHEWLDIKAVHWLSCLSQVRRAPNVLWPLQGSFWLWYRAQVGQKPSFTIFAMERALSRVFGKSKRYPWVTWHGSSALSVMSITSAKALKCYMAFPRVLLVVKWGWCWPKTQSHHFGDEKKTMSGFWEE